MNDPLPFQVDLRGVVDLLSRHIYSSPRVYLRELLQNGRDAIHRRAELAGAEPDPGWGITITPVHSGQEYLLVADDGVGLTAGEVADLLATVGRSSKRDIFDLPRSDYLGQFGIGLLSCFMVADRIVIHSRSAIGEAPPVEWIGDAAGVYTMRELSGAEADAVPVGTQVRLTPRGDERSLTEPAGVLELARTFGEFLPIPVRVQLPGGTATVSSDPMWRKPFPADLPSPELLAYGQELIGTAPLDVIELSVPGTDTVGVAFVLPYSPSPGSSATHRVYLGRMLLGEHIDRLLPEWAFFVRCVIDTTALSPTASRESVVDDDALQHVREQLGAALISWVRRTGTFDPDKLVRFVAVHYLSLKALALHDDALAAFIMPWLPVHTSAGLVTIGDLIAHRKHLAYAETTDEFVQIASITTGDAVVVNGGYVYDADLMRRLPQIIPGITTEQVTLRGELDQLQPPPLAMRDAAIAFEKRAAKVLVDADVTVLTRRFRPDDVPALYLVDDRTLRSLDRRAAMDSGSGLWSSLLGTIDDHLTEVAPSSGAVLCLNVDCALIVTVMSVADEAVFARTIQLIYVQALLAGHQTLRTVDRQMLTGALSELVALSARTGDAGVDEA